LSLKHMLMPLVAEAITSPRLQQWRRSWREWRRRLSARGHQATFYFRADDPYSWLMLQVLPELREHFRMEITPRVMLYLDDNLYPAPEMLEKLAIVDAQRLAAIQELEFPQHTTAPDADAAFLVTRILLKHEQDPAFWNIAHWLCQALWRGESDRLEELAGEYGTVGADQARLDLEARRDSFIKEGHYLTGNLHYEGEWYWSVERLDHLVHRLMDVAAAKTRPGRNFARAKRAGLTRAPETVRGKKLSLFFSFRSPYSYIALERSFRFADYYQLELDIRPVLPMVMRGLAVPAPKRFYILRDAAREARLYDVPFGRVCDPVGPGVERCMAIWPFAEKEGRLRQWLMAAATGIWSRGINVATDKGLKQVCQDAGLDWNRARRWLDDDGWKERAETNRAEMMAAGSWGVPGFQLEDSIVWGQDRFGVLEKLLLAPVAKSKQPEEDSEEKE
jgi:2-hydroxychromene-2-carboxylate isomerase